MASLTKNDWQNALYTEGACNSSGLINSLAEVLPRVRADVYALGGGTDEVNAHPIVQMYIIQIYWLAMHGKDEWEVINECKKLINEQLGNVQQPKGSEEQSETC